MRSFIPIASLLLAMASPASASPTPFDLLADGSIVVSVTIAGTNGYRFVIDTGSSRTVIAERLWRALKLPVVAKTVMVTPAGRDEAFVVRVKALAIGDQPASSVDAAVMARDRYADGTRVDGLIGQDLLASLVYTIDYRRRLVTWHGEGDQLDGERLPLSIRDSRVLVTLDQPAGEGPPLALVPDTGSDDLVLFAHATKNRRMTTVDAGLLTSLSGSRPVRRVQMDGLAIGATRWRHPLAVVVDTDEAPDLMGDGLLPLHQFARVTFNVGEGYLLVQTR